MNVLIFGGTGFIGRNLTTELRDNGYDVCVITRNRRPFFEQSDDQVRVIEWSSDQPLATIQDLKNIDVVVNLAGESIGSRRWTGSVKQKILASRINTTQAIVTAINNRIIQPKVLISASAVGYYGPRGDEIITEDEPAGQDFLAQVCREWEHEAYRIQTGTTRVLTIRIGVVLGAEGALNRMALPFKLFLGGPLGSSNQWLSWVHVRDLTRMIRFAIEHEELSGPVNGTAPQPAEMKDFCKVLGETLHRPSWLPVPAILLRLGLGQMSDMLLHGQRVVPKKIVDSGFEFEFPNLRHALENALRNRSKHH